MTVKELHELCGYLNFLCKAIFPGRPFLHRMYSKYSKYTPIPSHRRELKYIYPTAVKPHHYVRLDKEFREDCKTWIEFLDQDSQLNEIVNRPMIDLLEPSKVSTEICFYSDASASAKLGFGCILDDPWIQEYWSENGNFIEECKPSIEYLELFALVVGLFTWERQLSNCRITVFCDNKSVLSMINNLTSSCKNCMVLIHLMTLNGLQHNRRVTANYVSTKNNYLADSLSHGQITRFHKLRPHMKPEQETICAKLWPLCKLWIH